MQNNQEQIQKAFMAFLIEDAAQQGVEIQSEQDLQAYAEELGKEGLQAKYQQFMQKMQGGVKARLGAKLNYIKSIKNDCPDGYEKFYFKSGGQIKSECKVCNAKKAMQSGGEVKKNSVQNFKQKKKENKLDPKTTKTLPNGKYPSYWTTNDRITWERLHGQGDEGAGVVQNKGVRKNQGGGGIFAMAGAMRDNVTKPSKKLKTKKQVFPLRLPDGRVEYFNSAEDRELQKTQYESNPNLWKQTKDIYGQTVSVAAAKQAADAHARASREAATKVLKADRVAEGNANSTEYNNKYKTFKEAYNAARARGDMWFDFNNKVYKSDLTSGNDNRADMQRRYGKYLGWRKDPNFGKESVKATTKFIQENIGDNPVLKPAEKPQYSTSSSIARNHAWGQQNPEDVANMWYKIGAGAAAATVAPMAIGPNIPSMLQTAGSKIMNLSRSGNIGDNAFGHWAARKAQPFFKGNTHIQRFLRDPMEYIDPAIKSTQNFVTKFEPEIMTAGSAPIPLLANVKNK